MKFYLGVDAGGTKTEFLLGDETTELARVRGGTIKRMKASEEAAASNLAGALNELSAITGIPMQSISRCCIGTAGETVPLVVDWLREAFGQMVGGELILLGDVEIALDAAFFGKRGVLALVRHRIQCCRKNGQREDRHRRRMGTDMADQGSGHFIGLEGLRRGFLAIDQRRASSLLQCVQAYWGLDSLEN